MDPFSEKCIEMHKIKYVSVEFICLSYSSITQQSNADLCLLNGLLSVSSVCWPLFAVLISLILFPCQGQFHSVWLFRCHILSFLIVRFLLWQVVGLSPNAQPGWSLHPIYNPRGRVAQLYPQVLGTHSHSLLRLAWTSVELFFSRHHNEYEICSNTVFIKIQIKQICNMVVHVLLH
jgi:hypothetical protein